MTEDTRIPFVMDVKSVRILTPEEAAAEREAASNVPLGPHDVVLPIKDAENLRYSPGLQEEIKRVQRAFDRRQAAEARRAALARDARQRYIPPGTPPMLRRLYQNMLPSPDDPRPEDFPPDDATPNDETPDDAPDRSGPTALGGLRSRYPRLFRSPQPPAPLTDDDPSQAAPPQDATTPSDLGDADPSPLPQTPAPMADTTSNTAADDDDGVALLASIDPLSRVASASTHGLVQYASNDRVQFDALSAGEQTLPTAKSQNVGKPKSEARQEHTSEQPAKQHVLDTFDNIENLAKLLVTEAQTTGIAGELAVAWVVRNRLLRNKKTDVTEVWGAFHHQKSANDQARAVARQVLSDNPGTDPTNGATHYYSPEAMPIYEKPPPHTDPATWLKKQENKYNAKHIDVRGGIDDQAAPDGHIHFRPKWTEIQTLSM